MAQTAEVTVDGWIVIYPRAFRVLTEHAPPRPWGYWDQVRSDLHEPRIVWLWARGMGLTVAGLGLPVAAVATGQWLLALGGLLLIRGLWLLSLWVYLAGTIIRGIRAHPVATGIIDGLEPHPVAPAMPVALATRSSGLPVNVGVEPSLAREIERAGTRAEVWFIDDPTFQYRPVFAARPVGPHPGIRGDAEPGPAPDSGGGK